ncbi:hypothetical protein TTRE_0000084101 [Trichuris trichiura]|uniref:Uncharacterized protein n=1 Tax=Trichuris trichiura TaxID=36087 RepID=A0A077YXT2_TRITR|nr:hypothetical protein TTRE_0000084101 [Trichuris trichiura]
MNWLCTLALFVSFSSSVGLDWLERIEPDFIDREIQVKEQQVRPKSGKAETGADSSSGQFFGRTVISRRPGSLEEVEIHEYQHQPSSKELIRAAASPSKGSSKSAPQVRKQRQVMTGHSGAGLSRTSSRAEVEAQLGLAGKLQGSRQRRSLASLGSSLMRLAKIADNPPGAAEMRKAEMERAAAAKAKAPPPTYSQTKQAPVQSRIAQEEDVHASTEGDVTEITYRTTPALESNVYGETEAPSLKLSTPSDFEPYAMYTDVPSYASRYRRDIVTLAVLASLFGAPGESASAVQDVPSSRPVDQGEALDSLSGQMPKGKSPLASEPSFVPPADVADSEAASNLKQPSFENVKSAPVAQDYAPDLKPDVDVPNSLDVGRGASEIEKADEPAAQGAAVRAPAIPPDNVEWSGPEASYSTIDPSYWKMNDGIDNGLKGTAQDFSGETKWANEPARWKRSFGSISSVGMQFASDQQLTGGVEAVPSSLPMSSMPARGGILDTYGGPLPSAESDMPLKRSFAPPADISGGGEAANSFRQPASVANALGGLDDFRPAPVGQSYAPGVKSGFEFLPSVPESFAVAPGASDVQKLDRPLINAPDSQLSGPPSAQGPDVPSMKYENYLPPPPSPECSGSFPVEQSGRLASSYSGRLPSSMPVGEGINEGY